MKSIKTIILSAFIVTSTTLSAQEYAFTNSNSEIKWIGKKVSGEHYGNIQLKEGKLTIKNGSIKSGTFVVNMKTITNEDLEGDWNKKLIDHLNSDDFFGIEKYPEAKLKISESSLFKNNVATLKGELTIKGQTHPITFEVKKSNNKLTSEINIDRTLYNIKYGSGKFFDNLGDKMIDDIFILKVELTL